MLKKIALLFLFAFLFLNDATAQYTQIGSGGFTSATYGPMTSDTSTPYYSRHAYIYPSASLTNLVHGDSITSLGFRHQSFDTLRGNCTFNIYIKSTSQADFGAGALNWAAETRNGMTLAYSGNPKDIIGNSPRETNFIFNQINAYRFDTAGGATNLQILVEFKQNANQAAPIAWFCESSFYVPAFVSGNETKYLRGSSASGYDSITTFSSIIKPTLKIYHPRENQDLEANRVYALGRVPLLMDQPDSIKAVIINVGKKTVYNHKIYLEVTGANSYEDSTVIDSIHSFEEQFVYFDSYSPAAIGAENLKIIADSDDYSTNNEVSRDRLVNYNIYSHANPFEPNDGGIGFNGTTGDFVAKFYVNGTSYINQIKVDFNLAGRDFQLAVWEDDGPNGLPGTELFVSDSAVTVSGTYIMTVLPRIQVTGGFYVGIRQTGASNVSFSFQWERPIRPNTFFFTAPAGDTNWTSFSPGFDFNFNIQPRLQVANDLAVLNIISPYANDTIRYSNTDSMDIQASIINFGFFNQGSFNVEMEILNRFNQVVYSSTQTASLDAGDTLLLTFDKFSRYNIGKFTARATVSLNNDSVPDNNSKEVDFFLVKDHDVAVDVIFEPTAHDTFEIRDEGFSPTVRIVNYGVKTQTNFVVKAELLNSANEVLVSYTKTESLGPELSKIMNFDSIYLKEEGDHTFRAYTLLQRDSFPENDTAIAIIHTKKSRDVKILNVIKPLNNTKYAKGTDFRPFINFRNDGIANHDSTYFYAGIYDVNDKLLYADTVVKPTYVFSTSQTIFNTFYCDSLGDYTFKTRCFIEKDQLPDNDTASTKFSVVTGNDLQLVKLLNPLGAIKVNTAGEKPMLIVKNGGLNAVTAVPVAIEIENNLSQIHYTDTIYVTLGSFSQDTFSANKVLNYDELGDYYVTVTNKWTSEDEPNALDTIESSYITRYQNDVRISNHLTPVNNDTVELFDNVIPRISVINQGLDSVKNIQVEVEFEDLAGSTVFVDTLTIVALGPNRATNLTSAKSWMAQDGKYTFTSNLLQADDNASNNSLTTSFEVVTRIDVKVDSVKFPKPNADLRIDWIYKPSMYVSNGGIDDLENIIVSCRIKADGSTIYNKSSIISLLSNTDTLIQFDSLLKNTELGMAEATFVVSKIGDQITTNDTVVVTYNVVDGAWVKSLKKLTTSSVYPNPFASSLKVSSNKPFTAIRIISISGKEVMVLKNLNDVSKEIELNVEAGTYLLEVQFDNFSERHTIIKTD